MILWGVDTIGEQLNNPERRRPGRPAGGTTAAVTHERLVKIAINVFSQHGYEGTTHQEVARRAGLSRPSMHYHFTDKRALYHDVIEATYTTVVAPAIDRAAHQTSLARQLSVFIEVAGAAVARDRDLAAFLCTSVAECQTRPELRHPEYDPVFATQTFLTWAVISAVERGELASATDVEPLVDTLCAMLLGMGLYAGYLGTPRRVRAMSREIQQRLTGTLGAGPTG